MGHFAELLFLNGLTPLSFRTVTAQAGVAFRAASLTPPGRVTDPTGLQGRSVIGRTTRLGS